MSSDDIIPPCSPYVPSVSPVVKVFVTLTLTLLLAVLTHTAAPQSDPTPPPASPEPSRLPRPPPPGFPSTPAESSATQSAGCPLPPHALPSRYRTLIAPPTTTRCTTTKYRVFLPRL